MYSLEALTLGLPEDVERYVMYGDFDSADRLIDIYMKRNIPELLKKRLQYEKRRIKRLIKDYIYIPFRGTRNGVLTYRFSEGFNTREEVF